MCRSFSTSIITSLSHFLNIDDGDADLDAKRLNRELKKALSSIGESGRSS